MEEIISHSNLIKNENASIPQELRFNAEAIINRYSTTPAQQQMIIEHESKINAVVAGYESSYQRYSNLYEELQSLKDPNLAENKISVIEDEIKTLNGYITSLDEINDTLEWLNTQLQTAKSSIKTEINTLIRSLNEIKDVYDNIKKAELDTGTNINLQNVYEIIYSPEDIPPEDIDNAIKNLKTIINEYLKSAEIDDEVIQSLSACIIYLGEFKKYQDLDKAINDFQDTSLSQVYIINIYDETDKTAMPNETLNKDSEESKEKVLSETETDITDDNQSKQDNQDDPLEEITYKKWQRIRRIDIAQYIKLLKSLPDIAQLLQTMETSNSISVNELKELQSYNDYVDTTLSKAYELNRNNLENINEVERARNFLKSDYTFMAYFSLFIAFFMDFASFLIGLFIYYNDRKVKIEKGTKEDILEPPK